MQDNFSGDLAELIRKSWSEPQATPPTLSEAGSPLGTLLDEGDESLLSVSKMVSLDLNETGTSDRSKSGDILIPQEKNVEFQKIQQKWPTEISETNNDKSVDYQLFKRHYHLTDECHEAITDILDDLDLGSSTEPIHNDTPLNPPVSMDSNQLPIRRGSLQEVQWVRQLLNPRSSFSGVSSNEPSSSDYEDKCWVTILDQNADVESLKSIVVLNQSLRQVRSKYSLCVLYSGTKIDISLLQNLGIKTVDVDSSVKEILSINGNDIHPNLSKLFLFMALVNSYELVCYLSSTCMVVENIDELLSSNEVCDEIDNETCVLLTNDSSYESDTNDLDDLKIIILRPNNEVAMCIREFFTVYGNGINQRNIKLSEMHDTQILKKLFGETWARLSSEGYYQRLQLNTNINDITCKLVDYKILKPWIVDINSRNNILHNPLYGNWYHAWYNATKR